ncbi:MAG: hypothetical protein ACYS5W_22265, partial [Planctomycetota bacterium]
SHAQFRIGEIYESKTFNYLDALKAYQKVTWGSWVAKAKQRIARLTKKSLGLVTKRTYRTGEKATFKLTSRASTWRPTSGQRTRRAAWTVWTSRSSNRTRPLTVQSRST